jgi:protein gp37
MLRRWRVTASKIEWTDAVWNPVRGCSRVSEGCRHCYAERQAARFANPGQPFEGFVSVRSQVSGMRYESVAAAGSWTEPHWTGRVELIESKLAEPLSWRKPRRVFVNSMSDLFHESLPDEAIDRVFAVMALPECNKHTFQVLTKRPERMREYLAALPARWKGLWPLDGALPLPNLWLGVSIEDQASVTRAWELLKTRAALRFVSIEPLLGPIDLDEIEALHKEWRRGATIGTYLDWVIVGGESGPGARPCEVAWVRSIADQCRRSRVPVFVKQLGAHPIARLYDELGEEVYEALYDGPDGPLTESDFPMRVPLRDRKGGDPHEWPEDLRIREFPEVRRG